MGKPGTNVSIRARTPQDDPAIAVLIHAAFTTAFGKSTEARLVEALRRNGTCVCELVALDEGALAGHILFSRLDARFGTKSLKAVALAPLSVRPGLQRQGIGTALAQAGLTHCRNTGEELAVVLGHPDYYARFGFSALLAKVLDAPYSGKSFMALELKPGIVDGRTWKVTYPNAFSAP
ncbi:MAG: N-acetyltransferase [Micropepsaceae bacterium]